MLAKREISEGHDLDPRTLVTQWSCCPLDVLHSDWNALELAAISLLSKLMPAAPIPEVSVETLADYFAQPESVQLVDVREPEEVAIAGLPDFQHFPLSQYPHWSAQIQHHLDPHTETLVICHHGIRSAQMCQWLLAQGFTDVKNVAGGIDAYSVRVDPSVPRY